MIDFCGETLQTLLPSNLPTFPSNLSINRVGTRLYFVSDSEMTSDTELRWLPYPQGGAGTVVGAFRLSGGIGVDPGDAFAYYHYSDAAYRLDFAEPDMPTQLAIDPNPEYFAVSPDGLYAAFKDTLGDIHVLDIAAGTTEFAVAAPTVNIYPIRWVGTRVYHLLQVDFDDTIRAYDHVTKTTEDVIAVDVNFQDFTVSPDETWIAFGNGLEVNILAF